MTFELLLRIIKENEIPHDVILRSNSGWECDPTEMDGVWYDSEKNIIHFTQSGWSSYEEEQGFKLLYGKTMEEQLEERRQWRNKRIGMKGDE